MYFKYGILPMMLVLVVVVLMMMLLMMLQKLYVRLFCWTEGRTVMRLVIHSPVSVNLGVGPCTSRTSSDAFVPRFLVTRPPVPHSHISIL